MSCGCAALSSHLRGRGRLEAGGGGGDKVASGEGKSREGFRLAADGRLRDGGTSERKQAVASVPPGPFLHLPPPLPSHAPVCRKTSLSLYGMADRTSRSSGSTSCPSNFREISLRGTRVQHHQQEEMRGRKWRAKDPAAGRMNQLPVSSIHPRHGPARTHLCVASTTASYCSECPASVVMVTGPGPVPPLFAGRTMEATGELVRTSVTSASTAV